MRTTIRVEATTRGMRRLGAELSTKKFSASVSNAGADIVERQYSRYVPIGDKENRRYRRRGAKKYKRPGIIWDVTPAGNMSKSLGRVMFSNGDIMIGPRVKKSQYGAYAYYAYAHHKLNNPFMTNVYQTANGSARAVMADAARRLLKSYQF